jgi:hypothetical protein
MRLRGTWENKNETYFKEIVRNDVDGVHLAHKITIVVPYELSNEQHHIIG